MMALPQPSASRSAVGCWHGPRGSRCRRWHPRGKANGTSRWNLRHHEATSRTIESPGNAAGEESLCQSVTSSARRSASKHAHSAFGSPWRVSGGSDCSARKSTSTPAATDPLTRCRAGRATCRSPSKGSAFRRPGPSRRRSLRREPPGVDPRAWRTSLPRRDPTRKRSGLRPCGRRRAPSSGSTCWRPRQPPEGVTR